MRNSIVLAIILCAFVQAPASAADLDFQFGGNSYQIITSTPLSWGDAAAAAETSSNDGVFGHLCIIDSDAENGAIFDAMVAAGVNTVATDGGGGVYGWLGGSDDSSSISGAAEGEWFWVDLVQFWSGGQSGSSVGGAYSNWGRPQEPDNWNNFQDHLGLSINGWPFGDAREWNDVNGNNALAYCIEYEGAIFSDGFESGNLDAWTSGG